MTTDHTGESPRATSPTEQSSHRGLLWRSRWAALGAAVAVSLGAGGVIHFARAATGPVSSFVPITPVRILDTRDPTNLGLTGPFVSAQSQDLQVTGTIFTTAGTEQVVPVGATGVSMNVTAVQSSADGFVALRPADARRADHIEPQRARR